MVIVSIKHFSVYLYCVHFVIVTDHHALFKTSTWLLSSMGSSP